MNKISDNEWINAAAIESIEKTDNGYCVRMVSGCMKLVDKPTGEKLVKTRVKRERS